MSLNRRHFLQSSAILSAGALLQPDRLFAMPAGDKVRLGFIGVGLRGQSHLDLALRRTDVTVVSICDIDEGMLKTSLDMVGKSGKAMPKVYKGDNYAYRKLLEAKDIDAVVISTPWEWHKPMIIDALERGIKYVGTEVMLGITLQDHWDVVHAAEKYKA
nr:Gfo/Idh/MocA family oxidoreductase [Chitinophagaceae bacterium]